MNSTERKELKLVVAHIQNDEMNIRRAKEFSWVDEVNNIIHEPQVWLDLEDFRVLCKLAGITDYLTVSYADLVKYRDMRG